MNDKCVNQTSRNSSGNISEHWQIWLPSKQLSSFAKALESVANLMFFTDSNGDREEIGAICTLRPINMAATKATYDSGSFPIFPQSHLADLGVEFDSIDCNTQTTDNLQRCKNITKSAGHNSSAFKGLRKRVQWPVYALILLNLGFVAVFFYYSPAFLCFFSPTEVTEDGVHQIVLDGASPVGFRSLIGGNYFFSKERRLRMFVLRAVVLPFPFLGPAIFAEYLMQNNESLIPKVFGFSARLFHPLMIVSYVCYYIMVCVMSFSPAEFTRRERPCTVKLKTLICQENVPKRITNHLRIQPLILAEYSSLFIRHLLTYFKRCSLLIPSAFEFSSSFFLRLLLFIVLLLVSPAATVILLILTLQAISIALSLTCPLINVFSDLAIKRGPYFRPCSDHIFWLILFLRIVITSLFAIPALLGAGLVLLFASVGVDVAIVLAFVLLLTKESLPFAACSVLVLYYLWSSYSSFTNKYQDLGLALFKHYKSFKTSRHGQITDVILNTDPLLENTQNASGNSDNPVKIPKELFQMAYEELMPIRESVCVLILKVTLIVSFVLFVFSLIMLLNVSATPAMKAFLTFASGSLPKIFVIYTVDGRRQKDIETLTADEKIPLIVQKYTEAIFAVNKGQENSGVDIDEEMSQNVNEENIQLVII